MKKTMIIGVIVIATVLVAGCTRGIEKNLDTNQIEPTISNPGESNLVEIEKTDLMNLSDDAQKELAERKSTDGAYVFTDNNKNYLAVFAGERNTGGYGIEIIEVILNNNDLAISIEMTEPDPDMMVTQALTYPMDLVELKNIKNVENLNACLEVENVSVSHSNDGRTDEGYYISPTIDYAIGEIITVGDIVDFENQYIHIISGDLIEVFEYDMNLASEFYLGQTVKLVKGENGNVLNPFIIEDFSIRHTNMGHLIDTAKGKLAAINEDTITVLSEEKEMTFTFYEVPDASVGEQVEVHYMSFGEGSGKSIVALYRDASKMEMIIREIHRTDGGELMLYTSNVNSENIDYYVTIGSGTVVELNYSEIQVGDSIIVYADVILESYPAQVRASRVIQ